MEIQIQCTNGETSLFVMNDEQGAIDLIQSIRPSEFFHQPRLRIHVGRQTNIFNMDAIESIHFGTSLEVKTREQPPATDFRAISDDEYLKKLEQLMQQYESDDNIFTPGTTVETVIAIECASGKKFYLQVHLVVRHRVDQMMDLHNLLERLTSVIPCAPQGYIAINPHNIRKIDMYPAPQETMLTAWLADQEVQ